jgi:DNA-binding transcriptional LysR family regulator
MEIRQLRYFLASVRHGSLKEAAREHFVTQPAISIQLKKLEVEVGETLYIRRGRRIVPTEAGRLLIERAEDVLQRIDALQTAMREFKGLEHGFLRLGNIDAASIYVLPAVFRAFHRRYPGVEIHVVVGDTDSLVTALEAAAIELAIATLPLSRENLEVIPFYTDPMVLVVSPRHPLAKSRRNRRRALDTVADTGLITYPAHSTTRRLIESTFIENGHTLRPSMEMSSPEAIKRLTEAGLGASILPAKVVADEVRRGTLVTIPTGSVRFSRQLGIVYKQPRRLSPPATVFLQMMLERFVK